ncbi:cache domain-containing sensor histidine kinase [Capillibacterium thermochitinicola]|uniref:histidine kinase n=1 Tax=Capillibacterium thermochitinicola TaxID=2699427 RepID=A0A8J6LLI9_9FIRM|nr:sensor histidine kinase [Capillibacterium thermochitinicola]
MTKVRFFNSLRFKLGIIAVFLIGVPITLGAILYSRTVKEIIIDKYITTALESVYETGEKISLYLNDLQKFSIIIVSDQSFLEMLRHPSVFSKNDFNIKLRNFITTRADIEAIHLLLDKDYYLTGAKLASQLARVDEALINSSGQPVWLSTREEMVEILAGTFKKYYFTLGRKIIDFNTLNEYGYLLIDLDEVILEQAYTSIKEDEGSEVFICDQAGRIISHPQKNRIGESILNQAYAGEILANKKGQIQFRDRIEQVALYSTIDNGWKIIKTVPTSYLFKEINKIQRYLTFGGLFYGIAIVLYIILFAIRYTEPMFKIMNVIKRVEEGDLQARATVKTNDEIGQLGDSLNKMIAKMQILIDKLVKEEQEKKELELEALQAQINPHFLYNTLNTIKWMAKIQGNQSVSKAITALIKLLRISTNLGRNMISLREELDYVKDYMVIQNLRFNKAINIEYIVDESCLDLIVPKLILQPIVENSIIHGMENEELQIVLKIYKNGHQLLIAISDNGPGIKEEILENIFEAASDRNKFSKVGLNNVNQRIKLYCGNEYGLDIKTELGQGTTVILKLPC